jgi:hypothetical protein
MSDVKFAPRGEFPDMPEDFHDRLARRMIELEGYTYGYRVLYNQRSDTFANMPINLIGPVGSASHRTYRASENWVGTAWKLAYIVRIKPKERIDGRREDGQAPA